MRETLIIIMILGCTSCALYFLWKFLKRSSETRKIQKLHDTLQKDITSLKNSGKNWEHDTIHLLKKILAHRYVHKKPPSDTPGEIDMYIHEKNITQILYHLESAQYQGKSLSEDERKSIEKSLQELFRHIFVG